MSVSRQHAEEQLRRGGGSRCEERCTDRPLEPRPTLREQPDINNSVARGWNRDTSRRDEGSARTTPFTFHSIPTVDWGRNRGDKFDGSWHTAVWIVKWRWRHHWSYFQQQKSVAWCPKDTTQTLGVLSFWVTSSFNHAPFIGIQDGYIAVCSQPLVCKKSD